MPMTVNDGKMAAIFDMDGTLLDSMSPVSYTHLRPYSRDGRVQGTKGIWLEDSNGIFIEGVSPEEVLIDPAGNPYEEFYWEKVEDYYDRYDHPIWREYKNNPIGGHGGVDLSLIHI